MQTIFIQMKNKILFTVALFLMVSVFSACRKKRYPNNLTAQFELAVGNTWTYSSSYYYPDSAQTPNSTRQVVIKITKDTVIENNQLAYVVEQTTENNRPYYYLWYAVDNELRERPINSAIYSVRYKATMQTGDEWVLTPDVSNQQFNSRKVLESFSKFPVLNQFVPAYRLQNGNPDYNAQGQNGELTQDVYAPGIGIVESSYRINYYGPSRQYLILTDYYSD